jgi:hypothetical protein
VAEGLVHGHFVHFENPYLPIESRLPHGVTIMVCHAAAHTRRVRYAPEGFHKMEDKSDPGSATVSSIALMPSISFAGFASIFLASKDP